MLLNPNEPGLTVVDEVIRADVERTIATAGRCGQPWLDRGLLPILTRPGKRLRPKLVLAAAACSPAFDVRGVVKSAAAVELMHLSSLIHDDLMDEAASRSGVPTLHMTTGQNAALLGGDHLLGAGGHLAAEVSGDAARQWHQGYIDLCVGQIRETANRFRADTTIAEYLAAINGKTAALMRTSCQLGALCGGLDSSTQAALAAFGEAFGMVFQLVDDLMDVLSTEQLWTKPVEQDLANGVYTACVLAALQVPRSELRDLLVEGMSAAAAAQAHERVRRDGVAMALDLIEEYVGRAESELAELPDSAAIRHLTELPRKYAVSAVSGKVAASHRRWVPTGIANRLQGKRLQKSESQSTK